MTASKFWVVCVSLSFASCAESSSAFWCNLSSANALGKNLQSATAVFVATSDGEVYRANAIRFAEATIELMTQRAGLVRIPCESVTHVGVDPSSPQEKLRASDQSVATKTEANLNATQAGASTPSESNDAVKLRPELEEALKKAELLRDPENQLIKKGGLRLSTTLSLGLASATSARGDSRSTSSAVTQSVGYGVSDRISVSGGITAGSNRNAFIAAGSGTAREEIASSSSRQAFASVAYQIANATPKLPSVNASLAISAPLGNGGNGLRSSSGGGIKSLTAGIDVGRTYDSATWAASASATFTETGRDSQGTEYRFGPDYSLGLFGALLLNDRYSAFTSVRFGRSRFSSKFSGDVAQSVNFANLAVGFNGEVADKWFVSGSLGYPLLGQSRSLNAGVSIARTFD
jgi:hypothetical protein